MSTAQLLRIYLHDSGCLLAQVHKFKYLACEKGKVHGDMAAIYSSATNFN